MSVTPNSSLVQNILVGDLASYLRLLGWELVHPYKKGIQVFQGPLDLNGDPLQIVLPTDEHSPDKRVYTASALNLLSALEGEDNPEYLVERIKLSDRDILYIRNIYTSVQGTIDLPLAGMQVANIKQLLAYAACAEAEPRAFFKGVSRAAAKIVKNFQFAHTFSGSFGFTIEIPIGSQQELPLFSHSETIDIQKYIIPPIERRVMERLVRGLFSLQQALLRHDSSLIAREYPIGLNANMCRAILQMSDHYKILMEYKIVWSPKVPPSNDIADIDPIILDGEAYQYLLDAITTLKKIPPQTTTIVGNIVGLISKDDPMGSDDTPRLVIIRGLNKKDGTQINVSVMLTIEDYKLAYDVHINWKLIEISGELGRVGNTWQLSFYHDFHILPSNNQSRNIPFI